VIGEGAFLVAYAQVFAGSQITCVRREGRGQLPLLPTQSTIKNLCQHQTRPPACACWPRKHPPSSLAPRTQQRSTQLVRLPRSAFPTDTGSFKVHTELLPPHHMHTCPFPDTLDLSDLAARPHQAWMCPLVCPTSQRGTMKHYAGEVCKQARCRCFVCILLSPHIEASLLVADTAAGR
jgi:hypothetical protein